MKTIKIKTEVVILKESIETLVKIIKLNLSDTLTANDYDEMEYIIKLLDGLEREQL